ncbi:MAG: FHA domain-containing serine/threonine-protein kinase [Patescibacteria group bacterium]
MLLALALPSARAFHLGEVCRSVRITGRGQMSGSGGGSMGGGSGGESIRPPAPIAHGPRGTIRISFSDDAPLLRFADVPAREAPEQHDTIEIGPEPDVAVPAPLAKEESEDPRRTPPAGPVVAQEHTATQLPRNIAKLVHALHVGQDVKGYVIVKFLGRGGYAEVYLARHVGTQRLYAIKVLNVVQRADPVSVTRFHGEGRMLEFLRGTAGLAQVVELFDFSDLGAVIVMEFLQGAPLRQYLLKSRRVEWLAGVRLLKQLCLTLGIIHAKSIIHRDLKPENIMLEPPAHSPGEESLLELKAVIIDLGLAKAEDGPTTNSSSIAGTVHYASPEQLGRGDLTIRSDLYALACIAFEMFEGEHGYAYLARKGEVSPASLAANHVLMSVKLPEHMPVSLWNRVVSIGLEKDPDNRFQTAQEFARALHEWERDFLEGRLSAEDLAAPVDVPDRAKPPPKPLAREPGRVPDVKPREVAIDVVLKEPSLLVVDGPPHALGKRFAIGRNLTIGRWLVDEEPNPGAADLTLSVDTVSATHCKLSVALEEAARAVYLVEDLKSRNGTELGGVSIKDGLLKPGMTMRLGGSVSLRLIAPGRVTDDAARLKESNGPHPLRRPTAPKSLPKIQIAPELVKSGPRAVRPSPGRTPKVVLLVGIVTLTIGVLLIVLSFALGLGPWSAPPSAPEKGQAP